MGGAWGDSGGFDSHTLPPQLICVNGAFVVLNPTAGRGKGRGLERPLAEQARQLGWDVVVRVTHRAGEEAELAAEARIAGWPVVIAVGGDGTVHGTVNGLLADGPTAVTLAHVPVGTGNDYARTLGLAPAPVPANLERVLRGRRRLFENRRVGRSRERNRQVRPRRQRHSARLQHLAGLGER